MTNTPKLSREAIEQIAALRAENENLEGQHAIDLQNARLLIEQVEAAESQLTALRAEKQDMQVQLDHAKWRAEQSNGLRDEATNQLEALQAELAKKKTGCIKQEKG